MTDITPSRYTSETEFDVTIPVSVAGVYSIDVTNSSGIGLTPFTVNSSDTRGNDPQLLLCM